jgi:AcrR family transcriptional regulator
MISTKEQIASRLEQAFNTRGFAEPSVAELQKVAGVSLRTLYRHFPAKQAMVIGALNYRHDRYLVFLAENEPPPGKDSIVHLFGRLADWMTAYAPNGCLSLNALASHPGNKEIRDSTLRHKHELILIMARRSGQPALSKALFLLHEGASAAWPVVGIQAIESAQAVALKLIGEGRHQ